MKEQSGIDKDFLVGGFGFKGTPIQNLMEKNYTLLQLVIDLSGSVSPFIQLIIDMLVAIADKLSTIDTSSSILVRVVTFNTEEGVKEVHGYRLLENIQSSDYVGLLARGGTPLYDGMDDGFDAYRNYGEYLKSGRFKVNGINFFMTDGKENSSHTADLRSLADKQNAIQSSEIFDSTANILIEINKSEPDATRMLAALADKLNFDQFIDIANIADALASLINYVVTTTAQTSGLHGTGGKSQAIKEDFKKF